MTQGTKNKKVTTAGSLVFQDACNITTSRWETAHQGEVREEGVEYKTPSDKHESRACSLPHHRAHTGSSHSCLHCTKVPCIFFFSSPFFINETQHFWFTSSPAFSRSLSFSLLLILRNTQPRLLWQKNMCQAASSSQRVHCQRQHGVPLFCWANPLETPWIFIPNFLTFINTIVHLLRVVHVSRVARGMEGLL